LSIELFSIDDTNTAPIADVVNGLG